MPDAASVWSFYVFGFVVWSAIYGVVVLLMISRSEHSAVGRLFGRELVAVFVAWVFCAIVWPWSMLRFAERVVMGARP